MRHTGHSHSINRDDIDNLPSILLHVLLERFHHAVISSVQICFNDCVESVRRNIFSRRVELAAAVVDQPVETAEMFKSVRDHLFHAVAGADIALETEHFSSVLAFRGYWRKFHSNQKNGTYRGVESLLRCVLDF